MPSHEATDVRVRVLAVDRKEDMSPTGFLRLYMQPDGDVLISVMAENMHGELRGPLCVEFCTYAGGGRSPRTLKALRELMLAMAEDNADPMTNQSARHEFLGAELLTKETKS